MIIDFHTHCYPDKLASRAIEGLCRTGGVKAFTDGTLSSLRAREQEAGVSLFVVNNIAVDAARQSNVNAFAASINGGDVISFGSVHPFSDNFEEELCRLRANGIAGIKLHPYFQDFVADDPRLLRFYETVARLRFIVVFHAGCDISFEDRDRAAPYRLKRAAEMLAGTDVVLAHWGGSMLTEDVIGLLVDGLGDNVYFDTSFGYGNITPDNAGTIVKLRGADRILFGSDCPWHLPAEEIRFVKSLGLGEDAERKIFYGNAALLLGEKC
ncbi:MAG: amidohydrolase family protein [Clostridia bacterium]|nr:amidohydrolase family protein [Clostridia bacterium]